MMVYIKNLMLSLLGVLFCSFLSGQPTMKLDSALIKGNIRATRVERYEYYPDYSLKSDMAERVAFDADGRVTNLVNFIVLRASKEKVAGYETIYRYDEMGNLIELRDSIYPELAEEMRYNSFRHNYYSFDENNRVTSSSKLEIRNGRTSGFRFTYDYSSNRLVKRHQFVYTRARVWKGDRIVENPDPWKWVSTDSCDDRGNIVFYRDYNSGDTVRYQYDESDRMTKRERFRNGLVFERTDFIYDSFGNPLQMTYLNPSFGAKNLENITTSIIKYDLEKKAVEAAGVSSSDLCKRFDALKRFYDEGIDYYPTFINLPVMIMESWNMMPSEFTNEVVLYYSLQH